jgi:hypothetical protein
MFFLVEDGVSCALFENPLPFKLVYVVHLIILLLQFGVPILLIIFGMLDLGKAVIASKEDEIKKGQQMFIKRLIAAVIVFFVIAIVRLIVGLTADRSGDLVDCIDKIVNYNGNAQGEGYNPNEKK